MMLLLGKEEEAEGERKKGERQKVKKIRGASSAHTELDKEREPPVPYPSLARARPPLELVLTTPSSMRSASALHAPASSRAGAAAPARTRSRGAIANAAAGKPATATTTQASSSTTESSRVSPAPAPLPLSSQVSLALAAVAASAAMLLAGPVMPSHAAAAAVLESPLSAVVAASAEAVVADAAAAAAAEPDAPPAPITQGFWRRTPPAPPPAKRAPFLTKSGARGLLAEEEERLYNLRLEKEGEVIQELDRARAELLEEENEPGRAGKLCATPFGVDLVGILVFVALTGALVGGVSARSRKAEVERLNDQLRKINLSLRQQARAGTVYAPGLNYAPQPLSPAGRPLGELLRESGEGGGGGILAAAAAALAAPPPAVESEVSTSSSSSSTSTSSSAPSESPQQSPVVSLDDEEVSAELRACVSALREGKRLLKERQGPAAMVRFEKALMLAEALGDKVHEKRAVRGLAAAARLNGDRRGAIGHLRRVLALSDEAGEHVGDADACGNIADLYTELGQFERAAEFYDRYISRMATDGPV